MASRSHTDELRNCNARIPKGRPSIHRNDVKSVKIKPTPAERMP